MLAEQTRRAAHGVPRGGRRCGGTVLKGGEMPQHASCFHTGQFRGRCRRETAAERLRQLLHVTQQGGVTQGPGTWVCLHPSRTPCLSHGGDTCAYLWALWGKRRSCSQSLRLVLPRSSRPWVWPVVGPRLSAQPPMLLARRTHVPLCSRGPHPSPPSCPPACPGAAPRLSPGPLLRILAAQSHSVFRGAPAGTGARCACYSSAETWCSSGEQGRINVSVTP